MDQFDRELLAHFEANKLPGWERMQYKVRARDLCASLKRAISSLFPAPSVLLVLLSLSW
jgi:hypothetical protein